MAKDKENKDFYATTEIAKILGISRVAVFKKIKKGDIQARKIGRNFVIPRTEVESILGKELTEKQKKIINEAVDKAFKDYGPALKMLGDT